MHQNVNCGRGGTLEPVGEAPIRIIHKIEENYLGETLTMVAWLTMVNHGWTMVDIG